MNVVLNGMLLSHCESGVEGSILNLARALSASGSETYTLLAPRRFAGSADLTTPRFRPVTVPVPAHYRLCRVLWEQLVLPGLLARMGADLVHAPAYLAPLRARTAVALTVYDVMAFDRPGLCRPENALNYRLFMPPSIRRADAVILPSRFSESALLRRFPFATGRTRVVGLGVGADMFCPVLPEAKARARKRLQLPDRYVLFVGRREAKKNLTVLVEALHLLKTTTGFEPKLVLAGASGWGAEVVVQRVKQLGLTSEVLVPGFVANEDLPALYAMARAFVFPSLYEGFGLPPLEAMACGVPVVCSEATALRETAGQGALLVDANRPAALADAMLRAHTDEALRGRLIACGREWSARFTWERTVRLTDAVYAEAVAHRARGAA